MKSRLLVPAVMAGLIFGFSVRLWIRPSMKSYPADQSDAIAQRKSRPVKRQGTGLPAGSLEARISHYLNTATSAPSAPAGAAAGGAGESDLLLYLLRGPVSAASIRDAITTLNASEFAQNGDVKTAIFERWAREAPEEALAAAPGLQDPASKAALVWNIFQSVAGDSGILSKAMALPAGIMRASACAAIVEGAPPDQLPDLLRQSMRGRSPSFQMEEESFQSRLIRSMFKIDPDLPMRLSLETTDPAWRTGLLKATLKQFPENNPAGFQAKIASLLPDPRNAEALGESINRMIMLGNAQEGLEICAGLPEAQRLRVLRDSVGFSIYRLTDDEFQDFAKRTDAGTRRLSATVESFKLLRGDLEQREGAESFRAILADSALATGAEGLSNTAKWLESQQDAAGLDDLTRRAIRSEPYTTARWLATLPPSAGRDHAVAIFAETHAASDPERATTWAESITDPGLRKTTLTAIRKNARK